MSDPLPRWHNLKWRSDDDVITREAAFTVKGKHYSIRQAGPRTRQYVVGSYRIIRVVEFGYGSAVDYYVHTNLEPLDVAAWLCHTFPSEERAEEPDEAQ